MVLSKELCENTHELIVKMVMLSLMKSSSKLEWLTCGCKTLWWNWHNLFSYRSWSETHEMGQAITGISSVLFKSLLDGWTVVQTLDSNCFSVVARTSAGLIINSMANYIYFLLMAKYILKMFDISVRATRSAKDLKNMYVQACTWACWWWGRISWWLMMLGSHKCQVARGM